MNYDEQSLMRAVIAKPEDDACRLIIADWYEENGQLLRSEFIRVQIALWARDPNRTTGCGLVDDKDPNYGTKEVQREWEIMFSREYWTWGTSAPVTHGLYNPKKIIAAKQYQFSRGFPYRINVHNMVDLGYKKKLFKEYPITNVFVVDKTPHHVYGPADTKDLYGWLETKSARLMDGMATFEIPKEIGEFMPIESKREAWGVGYSGAFEFYFPTEREARITYEKAVASYMRNDVGVDKW